MYWNARAVPGVPQRWIVAMAITFLGCVEPAHQGHTTQTSDALSVRVTHVFDGDSFAGSTDAGKHVEVRVFAIDAPERRQPFSTAARRRLSSMIRNQKVDLEVRDVDRYGRLVAVVRLNGEDAGLDMIGRGLAWHFTRFAENQPRAERAAYENAQHAARRDRVGLWKDPSPVAPWDFRRALPRGD